MNNFSKTRLDRSHAKTLWMTGLSGAGKSTLAGKLEEIMLGRGCDCMVLDGDKVRTGLCNDLGFSKEDRIENIRRIAEVAKLFNQAGLTVIAALIAPFEEQRVMAMEIVGADNFLLAHISTPLEECERRDPKGLYAKARSGDLPYFTGITSPYEAPTFAHVTLDTSVLSVDVCLSQLVAVLA